MESSQTVEGTQVPNSFLEPMGYLTIWFSLLEAEIDKAIWRLLDSHWSIGIAVTAQFNSFAVKVRLLTTLIDERTVPNKQKERLVELIGHAETANTERNKLIHGQWFVAALLSPGLAMKAITRAHGKISTKIETYSPEDVMEIAELALALSRAFPLHLEACSIKPMPAPHRKA